MLKLTTLMAPLQQQQQRRHQAGVLHAALLLLCLALLMRASAISVSARPVPSDNDNGCNSEIVVCRRSEEAVSRSQEVSNVEKASFSHDEFGDVDMKDCLSLLDSTTESCADEVHRRLMIDYPPPGGNEDDPPGGPLP